MRHYLIVSIIVSNRDISYISSSVPHTIQFQSVLPARLQIAYIHPRQYFCCHWKVHFQIFGRDLKGGSHYGRLFWLASRLFRAPSQKPGCPAPGACLFLVVGREAVLPEMSQMRPPRTEHALTNQNKLQLSSPSKVTGYSPTIATYTILGTEIELEQVK